MKKLQPLTNPPVVNLADVWPRLLLGAEGITVFFNEGLPVIKMDGDHLPLATVNLFNAIWEEVGVYAWKPGGFFHKVTADSPFLGRSLPNFQDKYPLPSTKPGDILFANVGEGPYLVGEEAWNTRYDHDRVNQDIPNSLKKYAAKMAQYGFSWIPASDTPETCERRVLVLSRGTMDVFKRYWGATVPKVSSGGFLVLGDQEFYTIAAESAVGYLLFPSK